jgi:chromosome segregation protein
MKINRLRLLGFKSFVEPTELIVEPGLTGVVGPNGCGKSNLLEALRWVMGETSHKSMRAAAMDDVIFSGTNTRPGRNTAEVTIFIDNTERQAPPEFNDQDVIEITRRIEREAGSAYRINGREVRARDVKILFEDAATGARSPALVRQGQIAEIVNAKPEQRRRILEDAAGVAGLHSRRHEAELRLKAAENNLARLTDILGQLNSQIESLKRQARQAKRYKEISGEIRKVEALAAHLSWAEAQAIVASEEGQLTDALARLAAATEVESKALREEAAAAERLPPLREAEAQKGAAVGRLQVEIENFEEEAKRATERERELKARIEQLDWDITREQQFVAEAKDILISLDRELLTLETAEHGAEAEEASARAALDRETVELERIETRLSELTEEAAQFRARKQSLEMSRAEREQGILRIERQLAALASQSREISARATEKAKLQATTEQGQRLAHEIAEIEKAALDAEDKVRHLAQEARTKREEAARARLAESALSTERATLSKLVAPLRADGLPPVVEKIRVVPGYEAALAAALGDDLDAPTVPEAPVHWCRLDAKPDDDGPLPSDVEPLSLYVEAPQELTRRLRQIGIARRSDGNRLQLQLRSGQRLVSLEGDLWRWDGFVAAAGDTTPAAQRLKERNRLAGLLEKEQAAHADVVRLSAEEVAASEALAAAEAEERRLRTSWREAQAQLAATRDQLTAIERQSRETESKLAAIAGATARAEEDLSGWRNQLSEALAALDDLSNSVDPVPALEEAQKIAALQRSKTADARAKVATLEHERRARSARTSAARAEYDRWTVRSEGALQQIETLSARRAETDRELSALSELPARFERRRQALLTELSAAERRRREAADMLADADNSLRCAVQELRAAQAAVSAEREAKARTEARLEGARMRRQEESRRIREAFGVAPDEILTVAEVKRGADLPSLAAIERELAKLKSDRERLGGVNLQADEELTSLSQQYTSMDTERQDVEQAINKLHSAIGHLNREAKQRLDEAFTTVDSHFSRLFATLFGGGEARLEMVESEDPLEGGLEIIAKPPGKKPATLSLLSGGEQTLTALALIFAVFLTNPSPICVLDEVDAPLDDANVDRFCTLMEKMAEETATRFLVITHHPMTMTRMNRLFGVTMAEKGISQLVSVDLETAQRFREAG